MSRENITFGGNAINILGEEIKVGDKAPDFVAVNNDLSPFGIKRHRAHLLRRSFHRHRRLRHSNRKLQSNGHGFR